MRLLKQLRFNFRHCLPTCLAVLVLQSVVAAQPRGYVHFPKSLAEVVFKGDAEWLASQTDPKSHWHTLPSLKRVTLVSHAVSVEEVNYIATLRQVTELDVGSVTWGLDEDQVQIGGEALAQVGRMTWLEELEVSATGFQEADWSFLRGCKSLKALRVGPNVPLTDAFFAFVAELGALETLDLRGTNNSFSDAGLASLAGLRKLRVLQLSSTRLTDEGIKSLSELKELEQLRIFGNLTAKSVEHLRGLRNLRHLALRVQQLPPSAIETIARLERLEVLDLSRAEFGDDELAALRGHPSLKRLYLRNARLTERSTETLQSLERLEHVSIHGDDEAKRIADAINRRIRMRD